MPKKQEFVKLISGRLKDPSALLKQMLGKKLTKKPAEVKNHVRVSLPRRPSLGAVLVHKTAITSWQ